MNYAREDVFFTTLPPSPSFTSLPNFRISGIFTFWDAINSPYLYLTGKEFLMVNFIFTNLILFPSRAALNMGPMFGGGPSPGTRSPCILICRASRNLEIPAWAPLLYEIGTNPFFKLLVSVNFICI